MMATWHPEACAPGARVSYWITSSRLGGLVFGAASWHQKARDDFWSQGARVLGEIVNNDRFLILPSVHVQELASHALACRRLAAD